MDKSQVSSILNEIGLLLELVGENPFKVRAYYQAARTIEGLDEDLDTLARENRLGDVSGLGPALKEKITTLVMTGRLPYYEDLRTQVPPGLLAMLRLPGLGPRKVQTLHRVLGLTDLAGLEEACREHRVQGLPGFGPKTELKILAGLEWFAQRRGQHLWVDAWMAADELRQSLAALAEVSGIDIAGSLRRRKEIVKDIDLVAVTAAPAAVAEAFINLPSVGKVNARGETRVAVTLQSGIDVDLRLAAPEAYAALLLHLTGSKEHNAALRGLAKERGLKLNEYGLYRGDERLPCLSEEEIYRALGLQYIPPELREDLGEIEAAATGNLPPLIEASDVRGALHNHTSASDGTASLAEMAAAAAALGWEYLGLADHSQSAYYAGGLRPESVLRQREAVAAHNRTGRGPYLLAGIESEIRPDGSLDYPDEILASFDYVVASIHTGMGLGKDEMTARILKALRNPHTTILGHPTGRLLLQREAYAIDLDAVLDAAAANGVAIEINASPYRLDLDWRWCQRARDKGLVFWVNPDAHSTRELANYAYGIGVARKGWLRADQVGNTWTLAEVWENWRKKRS